MKELIEVRNVKGKLAIKMVDPTTKTVSYWEADKLEVCQTI